MRPVRIRSSASSASSARPSESAPPITPERWPPKYSSQESGAPEVRTVAGVRPGTTSIAGRTSTSTGSAAHMRSSASAFACSRRPACWATASGERLVITLLEQLELLPLAVDSRPEVFGVLSRPDLRANDEVVRVEVEGCPPDGNRLLFLPIGVEGNSFREALEGSRIHGSFRVRRLGRLAGEEPLQIPAHAGVCDVEVLHVVVADDPLGVDEEPARNDLKSEHASKVARTVDQDREAHVPLLHNGPDPLRPRSSQPRCHPGSCSRHVHQVAKQKRTDGEPRRSALVHVRPSRSGRTKSGSGSPRLTRALTRSGSP